MNFNLTLTADQIALIGKSLGDRPYHEVVGLINEIQNQVNMQMQAMQQPRVADEPAPRSKK